MTIFRSRAKSRPQKYTYLYYFIDINFNADIAGRLLFLDMMKSYNFFQVMDVVFRELAKVLLELKQEGIPQPSEAYHSLLNSTFFVNQQKEPTFKVILLSYIIGKPG